MPMSLSDLYDSEQAVVRSLFKAFVESVSDVTFGSPTIAKFIQDGSLSVSDGILRVSPAIQSDDAFSWWITTLISFTARTMLSIEGLCARDRTAICSNLCKLSPYFSLQNGAFSVKHHVSTCRKYRHRSLQTNSDERSPPAKLETPKMKMKCPSEQCLRQKKMQCELEMHARILQNYWRLIRQSVQRLMRGEPIVVADVKYANRDDALATGISTLCKLDPYQLFKRLECVSREHVIRIKISLWDILVTPNKVTNLKKYYDENQPENILIMAQTKHFIKSLLDEFSKFQEAVKEVSSRLVLLDEEYLKQFGITWKVINHHLFDKMIYQDDLFKSFIPHMESALQVQLTEEGVIKMPMPPLKNEKSLRDQFPELFTGLPELMKSFQLFHRLLLTSREMFRRADLLMQTFIKQQYSLHSRAKVEILEKDLDFFTRQRRMVRNFVCDPKRKDKEESNDIVHADNEDAKCEDIEDVRPKKILDEQADEAEFIRRFRDLLDYGPNSTGHCKSQNESKQETECKYCNQMHCWCDECSFYHMILCGLVDGDSDAVDFDHANELRNILFENSIENELKFYEQHGKSESNEDKEDMAKEENDNSNKLNSLSLFTLHETAEYYKHIVDSQSTWDVGNFEINTSCKCECEESDDENCSCAKLSWSVPSSKSMSKRQWDFQQRISSRITPKKTLHKRAKSSVTGTIELRQCFVSENKKSVIHMDKKGICVTQITKSVRRGMPVPKNAKVIDDSCSDLTDESSEENDDVTVDIQKISENIVREIEKSLANSINVTGDGIDKNSTNSTDYFSNFFGPGCRKLIDSLMKRTVEGAQNVKSTNLEEDTDESLSISSSIGRCSHDHDHHDSCQGNIDDQKERFGRCDCCYCTYMANDIPSRHDSRRSEEIRQRLRKVLKQREEQTNQSHSMSSDGRIQTAEKKSTVQPTVDELLQFINEKKTTNEVKAAKKARQKQRKLEEKMKKEGENLREEKQKKKLKNVNSTLQKDKNPNSGGGTAEKLKDLKTNKKNEAPKIEGKKLDKSKTKNAVKEKIKSTEAKHEDRVKLVKNQANIKSAAAAIAESPFVTPTKLSRAFEDPLASINGVKGIKPTISNLEPTKEEKPKLSFKSQAALASRAAQDGKRIETKRPEPAVKTTSANKSSTISTNEKPKRGNAPAKYTPKNEEKPLATAVHRPIQAQLIQAGTNDNRPNSFAQSVVCGVKPPNQTIPIDHDVKQIEQHLNSNSKPENMQQYFIEANKYHQNEAFRHASPQINWFKQTWSQNQPTPVVQVPINTEVGAIGSGRPAKSQCEMYLEEESEPNDRIQSITSINGTNAHKLVTNIDDHSQQIVNGQQVMVPNTAAAKFGAIGQKPVPHKAFNPYAAYDRETHNIRGLSQSPLNNTLAQQMSLSFNGGLSADRCSYPGVELPANRVRPMVSSFYTNGYRISNGPQLIQPQSTSTFSRPISFMHNDVEQVNKQRLGSRKRNKKEKANYSET